MSGLEIFFGVLLTLIAFLFTYVGVHIGEERRLGKHIPLIWEKREDAN